MIYVSHRLDEVFEVADEVAVLRDGRLVGRKQVADTTPGELVTMIVGRPPEQVFVRARTDGKGAVLELRDIEIGAVGPVSLTLRAGEIVGLVGLRGAGQEQVGRALFGLAGIDAGTASLAGQRLDSASPGDAMRVGVGLVAGDRTAESLRAVELFAIPERCSRATKPRIWIASSPSGPGSSPPDSERYSRNCARSDAYARSVSSDTCLWSRR